MRIATCDCLEQPGSSYHAGPTACMARGDVLKDIRSQISASGVLSAADARMATLSGLLDIPAVGRTGFNDGMIYPPDSSGVDEPALAGARPTARFAMNKPSGKTALHCLVLLVDFEDNPHTQNRKHFDQLLFDAQNPNSMATFYKELSHGALTVTGQVTDWMRAPHPYSHYTNGESGTGSAFPKNTPGLLQDMLKLYCATNSLSSFDLNQDGYIDGLFLVHAGGGAEAASQGRKDMIWSHKWTLPSPFVNDGIRAYAYFTAPEDGKLGVFAHEFGHFLGLPDLYDTSYRSNGIGDWCLMAGGSWNGEGDKPARMSAWCLSRLGWITPTNVTSNRTVSLETLEANKTDCYRVWSNGNASSKEYFLIENRQKTGRDSKLPGKGLAVWHIDETQSDNTNPLAYKVALVQADGKRDLEFQKNTGDPGDLFPGNKAVTALDDQSGSHPHTRDNGGAATGVSFSAIAEKNGKVSVTIGVTSSTGKTAKKKATTKKKTAAKKKAAKKAVKKSAKKKAKTTKSNKKTTKKAGRKRA